MFNKMQVIKFGSNNIDSIVKFLSRIGFEFKVVQNSIEIDRKYSNTLLLPGVGHFDAGMHGLRELNFDELIRDWIGNNNKVIGICLGMQLLGKSSSEGIENGLGLLDFKSESVSNLGFAKRVNSGWHVIRSDKESELISSPKAYYYFTHSFGVDSNKIEKIKPTQILSIDNTATTAMFVTDQAIGMQFHPEKSHVHGEKLFKDQISGWLNV